MFWHCLRAAALAGVFLLPSPAPAATSYTMEEAVARALEANPALESAERAVEAAESGIRAARGGFGPSVASSYGFTHNSEERLARGTEKHVYTFGVGVSQPVFAGFSLLNAYQKAALLKDNQELQLRGAQLAITAQVQQQFLNYLKAEENIRSTRRSLERARAQLNLAKAAFDVGSRPHLDVLQAEVDLSLNEATLIQSENAREICRARLNTLLGLPVEAPVEYVGDLTLVPFERTMESSLEPAFRQRPDVLMARKAVEIAGKDLGMAHSSFYPSVSASLTWGTSGNSWQASGGRLPQDFSQWQAGLSAEWVLFSSGKRMSAVRQARSQIASLEAQVRSAMNDAAFEIRAQLLSIQDARRTVSVAERSVLNAEESYKNARMRYELQLGTNLDLLTAQSTLASAELSLISAHTDYLAAISQAYIAMGEIHPSLAP